MHTRLKLTVVFGEIITNDGKNLPPTGRKTKSYLSEAVSVRSSASLWRETAVCDMNPGRPQQSSATSLFCALTPPPPAPCCDSYLSVMDQVEVASVEVVRPGRRSHGDRSKDRVPIPSSSPLPPITPAFFLSLHQITTGGHLKQSSITEVNLHRAELHITHKRLLHLILYHTWNFSLLVFLFLFPLIIFVTAKILEFTSRMTKQTKHFHNDIY